MIEPNEPAAGSPEPATSQARETETRVTAAATPGPSSGPIPLPGAPPAPPVFGGAQPPPPPLSMSPGRSRRDGASRWLIAVIVPVLAVVLFAGGLVAGQSGLAGAASSPTATPAASSADAELALIEEAWNTIHEHYVDAPNLDNQAMAYAAIGGMTDAVGDEGHTSFLTAAEANAVDESLSGTFVGIGVQVDTNDSNGPVINTVIPNTPAQEAGLQRGDKIVAVDGTPTDGESIDMVVSRIRGPEGQAVTLTIERAGRANFDVTIVRRKFDLPLVSWTMVPGRTVALIRLDQFATGATKAIQDAITRAKGAGATAVILDLRGNPGGYVNEAVGVASQFVGDGTVYRSIDASGTEKDVPVEAGGLWTQGPLVVLADGNTASSAEIVTGAIQDAGRGTVVGEKTFGTGTVLGRFDLADGSSLRIGVERWLTRAGRPIWHEGLEPDVKVALPDNAVPLYPDDVRSMTKSELASSTDSQLLKALDVLRGEG
jgi:carboxyl-terminal processing protease